MMKNLSSFTIGEVKSQAILHSGIGMNSKILYDKKAQEL